MLVQQPESIGSDLVQTEFLRQPYPSNLRWSVIGHRHRHPVHRWCHFTTPTRSLVLIKHFELVVVTELSQHNTNKTTLLFLSILTLCLIAI